MAHSVVDLFLDGGLGAVGYFAGDFEAADHGAGMQDECLGCMLGDAFGVGLVARFVFFEVEGESGKAFGLDAEHHDDLRLLKGAVEVALDFYTAGCVFRGDLRGGFRQQRRWAAEQDAGAEAREEQGIRAGDAAVKDVSADGDGDAFERGGGRWGRFFLRRLRMVRRSRRAWEGCSCMPSPALRMGRPVVSARRYGAPEYGLRRMMHSAPRARRVRPVSLRDSPFSMLEDCALTREVSAPRDLAASSNEVRVRVLDS